MIIKDEVLKEWEKQMIEEFGSNWSKTHALPPIMMLDITLAKVKEKIEEFPSTIDFVCSICGVPYHPDRLGFVDSDDCIWCEECGKDTKVKSIEIISKRKLLAELDTEKTKEGEKHGQ